MRLRGWVIGLLAIAGLSYFLFIRSHGSVLLINARQAYSKRDWSVAAGLCRQHLVKHPEDREALRILARSTARQGQREAAQQLYARLGDEGADAEDYLVLGTLVLRAGHDSVALGSFRSAVAADPGHAESRSELAALLLRMRQPVEAESVANPLLEQKNWVAQANWLIGSARLERGQSLAAHRAFENAQKIDPQLMFSGIDAIDARRAMARAALGAGSVEKAKELLSPTPGDARSLWLLSRVALVERMPEDASKFASLAQSKGLLRDPNEPEPAPYLGARACGACHAEQFDAQQTSRHARTLSRHPRSIGPEVSEVRLEDPFDPKTIHHYRQAKDQVVATVRNKEGYEHRAIIEYVLGSGDRGQTLVARELNGQARELRLSHYRNAGWDLTVKHPQQPDTLAGYLGRPISEDAVETCLGCHATTARAAREGTGPEASDRGIGCESCHGPGGNHLAAVELGWNSRAIARPDRREPSSVINLCGRCHSAPASASRDDSDFVRFQASTLVLSQCYRLSRKAFDCLTCHDPHQNAQTSAVFYESRCLSCHQPNKPDVVVCKTNPTSGCIACHMPSVPDVAPHTRFTDHEIKRVPKVMTEKAIGSK